MPENPVSEVVKVRDGQGIVVVSAKVKVEGWIFSFVRVNGKAQQVGNPEYLCSDRYYEPPPTYISHRAREIAGGLFSDVRPISRIHPNQGVLIPK